MPQTFFVSGFWVKMTLFRFGPASLQHLASPPIIAHFQAARLQRPPILDACPCHIQRLSSIN
jgi:hypothetical protein